jgi:hypothetical protein
MGEYAPSKRDVIVSAATTLGVGTPIALMREKAIEGDRDEKLTAKARAAARDSAKRMLEKLKREDKK